MGSGTSLIKNTIALSVPSAVNPLLSFVLVLVISRYLGVEGLGQYSLLNAFSLIFTTVASLGLGSLLVRQVAKKKQEVHVLLLNSLVFGAVSSVIAIVLMNGLMVFMRYDREILVAGTICSISLIPSTAIRYLESIFRGAEQSEYIAACYFLENLLKVIVCVALVLLGYGIITLFVAILATRLFGLLFLLHYYQKINGTPSWEFRPDIWQLFLREAPTFTGIAVFSTMHLNMEEVMLSKLKSIEAVGIYSAASRITSICLTLPMAFSLALLPLLSRKSVFGKADLRDSAMDSIRYMFIAVLPITVGTLILGDQVVELVYGGKFSSAGPVLRLQALALIPFSMVLVFAQVLIASDNQRVDLAINVVAVLISLTMNFALIPGFGEIGAVMAGLITIVIFNHLQYLYIRKLLFRIPFWEITKKPLLATLAMGVVSYVLRHQYPILDVGISALAYVLFLAVFRVLTDDEIKALKRFFRLSQ